MAYRFLIANMNTGEILEEIPLMTSSFEEIINGAGSLQGDADLRNPKFNTSNLYPMRNSIYVERNKRIVWGGMVTNLDPNTGTGRLKITAQGLWSYAGFRVLAETKNYLTVDQTSVIANGLVQYMLDQYDIGWALDTPASGVLRDRNTYYGYERRTIRQMIEQLTEVIDGFDFAVQSAYDGNGDIVDTFRTFYPSRGRRTGLKWTKYVDGKPGSNIDIISAPVQGFEMANSVHAIGSGEGQEMRISTATDPNLIGSTKYPLLERVTQHKTVRHSVTLLGHAESDLLFYKNPPQTAQVQLRSGHSDTKLGTFEPGDIVTVTANDGWLVLSGLWRIISYKVAIDESGEESVTAKISKVYNT